MNVEKTFKNFIKKSKLGPVAPEAMFMLKKAYFSGVQDVQDIDDKIMREAKLMPNQQASANYIAQHLKKRREYLDSFWKSLLKSRVKRKS
jgi:hypothetical protein